ncbi:MAG: hypothetical protein ACXWYT_05330 [Actinomycetota bacterium]
MAESLFLGRVELGTVVLRDTLKARCPMPGTTAVTSLDGLPDTVLSHPTDPPAAADVEAELQRIARQRLAPTTRIDVASRAHRGARSLRRRRRPIVGAFDSPEGFAFASSEARRG